MSIKKNEIKATKLSEALKKNIRRRKEVRKNSLAQEYQKPSINVKNIGSDN